MAEHEYAALPEDVRREPKLALVSGPTGLETYERIGGAIGRWLAPGGRFALEIGETQGDALKSLFADFEPEVRKDLTRRDRFLTGRKP